VKKVALVFVVAVIAPSLVLAWLAVRSAQDQQIVVAQQQTLLYQGVADGLAKDVRDFMTERQREFAQTVEVLRREHSSTELAGRFDDFLRERWPYADVGFAVTTEGSVLSPSLFGRSEARQFRLNNDRFLCAGEPVQVYWNSPKGAINLSKLDQKETDSIASMNPPIAKELKEEAKKTPLPSVPAKGKFAMVKDPAPASPELMPEQAEFKELVGDSFEGTVARFLQNRLKVLLWYRSAREPELIYGAQLNLTNITADLRSLVRAPENVAAEVTVALLNDGGKVVAGGEGPFKTFVTSDVGYALPHWKIALSLKHPESLMRSARTLKLTLLLIVMVMIAAIAMGSVLIVSDLRRQLTLARQKTDFVSNVSHELKTPLTSIRMFSELLTEGKVADEGQRKHFLQIISSETARLSRLINNVLDFARMERGEKKYQFGACDLNRIVRNTVESYRPQLEANGFSVTVQLPPGEVEVNGDCDALAQVLVNLLSNAEKYSGQGKEIAVELQNGAGAVELCVLDRGPGVPRGAEEKIFEQFYRAQDSLSSGIQGSGLGLTLARQIARAHGGDIHYEARHGGGSCFVLRMPMASGNGA
jgi:signal transduction histidine kinase